jgi:hypothetical protein
MSPLEAETARLTERVARLSRPAQVGLFTAAAEVLQPRHLDWIIESRGRLQRRSVGECVCRLDAVVTVCSAQLA